MGECNGLLENDGFHGQERVHCAGCTLGQQAAEYNDKMRAERAARVQAEADLAAERQARERAEARVEQLEDMYECVHCTQTARNEDRAERAEAALSRATELLKRFVRLLPRSLDMGRLPFAALHDEAAAFVAADHANTPKEPTADGK